MEETQIELLEKKVQELTEHSELMEKKIETIFAILNAQALAQVQRIAQRSDSANIDGEKQMPISGLINHLTDLKNGK